MNGTKNSAVWAIRFAPPKITRADKTATIIPDKEGSIFHGCNDKAIVFACTEL